MVLQPTSVALELRLQGTTKKLRSGVNGEVRGAMQQSIARILVGDDGSLTIEAKPGGLLGVEGISVRGVVKKTRRHSRPPLFPSQAGSGI